MLDSTGVLHSPQPSATKASIISWESKAGIVPMLLEQSRKWISHGHVHVSNHCHCEAVSIVLRSNLSLECWLRRMYGSSLRHLSSSARKRFPSPMDRTGPFIVLQPSATWMQPGCLVLAGSTVARRKALPIHGLHKITPFNLDS